MEKDMKYHDVSLKLMDSKNSEIVTASINKKAKQYFIEEDKKIIKKWNQGFAEKVAKALIKGVESTIINFETLGSINDKVCPFCIASRIKNKGKTNCKKCEYGKNHGGCHSIKSDFTKLIKRENIARHIDEVLTSNFYIKQYKVLQKILHKIEKKTPHLHAG